MVRMTIAIESTVNPLINNGAVRHSTAENKILLILLDPKIHYVPHKSLSQPTPMSYLFINLWLVFLRQ